jgi:glutamate 5-kinase
LHSLLELGVIPIVNENDTVSTMELERPLNPPRVNDEQGEDVGVPIVNGSQARLFGDNDKLSALLLVHIDADLLVLLSDVDGLYDRNPAESNATIVPSVAKIDTHILELAHGGNGRGRGGMLSKLESARIALDAGKEVVIANGRTPAVLERILAGEQVGTRFASVRETSEAAR